MVELDMFGMGTGFAGGAVVGGLMGWTARKIANLIVKIAMALAGIQLLFLAWLENTGIIDVNWDAIGPALTGAGKTAGDAGSAAGGLMTDVFNAMMTIVPASSGFALGAALGWKKGS